ncbi:MAG: hypothetical protein JXR97_05745 [Planctomycetes bacterium]|nr:hypothetical protein [Planctomycetota bacterium]
MKHRINIFLGMLLAFAAMPLGGLYAGQQPDDKPKLKSTPGLKVETYIGFGNMINSDLSTPVTLYAENDTGKTIDGQWEIVELTDGLDSPKRRVARRVPVYLNSPSKKCIRLALDLPDSSYMIRLRDGGKVYNESVKSNDVRFQMQQDNLRILVVDPARRAFQPVLKNRTGTTSSQVMPVSGTRLFSSVSISELELPDSAVPLFTFHAIMLSNFTKTEQFTESQIRALAKYLRLGGVIVLPPERIAFAKQVCGFLPESLKETGLERFKKAVISKDPGFRICNGIISLPPLDLTSPSRESWTWSDSFLTMLEMRPEPSYPKYLKPDASENEYQTPNASWSLMTVGGVFAVYALVSGPMVLLFFRKAKKRTMMVTISVIVGFFCLVAAVAAPAMGVMKGDLHWVSITELTPDGGNQWSMLTCISAGGKSHELLLGRRERMEGGMKLNPEGIEAILVPKRHNISQWNFYRYNYYENPLFTTCNLALDVDEKGEGGNVSSLPISPWGTRLLIANTFIPELRPLSVKVKQSGKGKIDIEITNNTGKTLSTTKLILGGYVNASSYYNSTGMENRYQTLTIPELPPNKKYSSTIAVSLRTTRRDLEYSLFNKWQYSKLRSIGRCKIVVLDVNSGNRLHLAIFAELGLTPGMEIGDCDFTETGGRHFIVQPVDSTTMPKLDALFSGMNVAPAPPENINENW